MKFQKVDPEDKKAIKNLSELATGIVKEHFDPIIGEAQNDYMIDRFQSAEAIERQMEQGCRFYFAVTGSAEAIGFMGFYLRKNELYLSKFYLKKEERGKGYAREMLQFLVDEGHEENLSCIVLNVNKNNPACRAYEKMGFLKIREEKTDIGSGFVMDDFVYIYNLT